MSGEGVKAVEGRGKEEERVEGEVVGTAIWEPAGQSRGIDWKIKEAEGRKPPPPPEYSLLSTLKRACQLRGRATREELPPSPAGEKRKQPERKQSQTEGDGAALASLPRLFSPTPGFSSEACDVGGTCEAPPTRPPIQPPAAGDGRTGATSGPPVGFRRPIKSGGLGVIAFRVLRRRCLPS